MREMMRENLKVTSTKSKCRRNNFPNLFIFFYLRAFATAIHGIFCILCRSRSNIYQQNKRLLFAVVSEITLLKKILHVRILLRQFVCFPFQRDSLDACRDAYCETREFMSLRMIRRGDTSVSFLQHIRYIPLYYIRES